MNAAEIARQKNGGIPRDLAVKIVDSVLGYTCEHSPNYPQHVGWYDWAEDIIAEYGSKSLLDDLEQARAELEAALRAVRDGTAKFGQIEAALAQPAESGARMAEGCCSAISPCSHQRRDPYTICDVCQRAAAPREQSASSALAEIDAGKPKV